MNDFWSQWSGGDAPDRNWETIGRFLINLLCVVLLGVTLVPGQLLVFMHLSSLVLLSVATLLAAAEQQPIWPDELNRWDEALAYAGLLVLTGHFLGGAVPEAAGTAVTSQGFAVPEIQASR